MHSGDRGVSTQENTESRSLLRSRTETHRQHDVQFYFDDQFLIKSLSAFVRNALDAGTSAIVVATASHCVGLADQLRRDGTDLTSVIGHGRYLALDAAETLDGFMLNGSPDEFRFGECIGDMISRSAHAALHENATVSIYGDMVSVLWQRRDTQGALRLEELWNQLSADYSFRLLCGCPITGFDRKTHTDLFARICCQHNAVIPAEGFPDPAVENDHSRTVALLQQTEQVLKSEVTERLVAEAQVREVQSQNQELVKELRKHEAIEEELRRFTRRLLTARDEEQRHIAAELHENTAQLLAALSVYFGVLHQEKASLNPRLAKAVASSRSVSDNLLSEIRKLSHLLHPPTLDDMGLSMALEDYIDGFIKSHGARVELEISAYLGRFDRNLEITVFRIVEEALANASPRSGTVFSLVQLTRTASALMLDIEHHQSSQPGVDGSPRRETRFTGIHERVMEHGGSVQFTSNPSGTRLAVKFPLAGPDHQPN
jgi:signal transduction histidine kinase